MGGRGKHKSFPDENNSKEKALRKLVKQQEIEIKRLKSELKTLNKVLQDNSQYIKQKLEKVQVENLVENIAFIEQREKQEAREAKKYVETKAKAGEPCPTCGNDITTSKLPFGKLRICAVGCGWRDVVRDK